MNQIPFTLVIDNEGKVHPRIGHEGPEEESIALLFLEPRR